MKMTKICTSLEQSQILIELGIDADTADIIYNLFDESYIRNDTPIDKYHTPAWSLSALMELMPKLYDEDDINDGGCQPVLCKGFDNNMWHVVYRETIYGTDWYCDPIDAAFDMVCWLLENKKI